MRNNPSAIIIAVMAFIALSAAVSLGHWESRAASSSSVTASAEDTARERKEVERRRGRVAVVAIAGATAR